MWQLLWAKDGPWNCRIKTRIIKDKYDIQAGLMQWNTDIDTIKVFISVKCQFQWGLFVKFLIIHGCEHSQIESRQFTVIVNALWWTKKCTASWRITTSLLFKIINNRRQNLYVWPSFIDKQWCTALHGSDSLKEGDEMYY